MSLETPQNGTSKPQSPLLTRQGYLSFLVDRLEQGKSDPKNWPWRQYGTLSAWAKLYADVQGWIPKTPINLTQVVSQQITPINYDKATEVLKEDEQVLLARAIDRITGVPKPTEP